MALTVAVQDPPVFAEFTGQKGFKRARVTFDSSYLTGGEVIAAADLGLSTIDNLQITVDTPLTATTSPLFTWSKAAGTIMAWAPVNSTTVMTEVASTTNLAASVVNVLAYGKLA